MTTSEPDGLTTEAAAELLRLAELVTEGLLDFDDYQLAEGELLGDGSAVVDDEPHAQEA